MPQPRDAVLLVIVVIAVTACGAASSSPSAPATPSTLVEPSTALSAPPASSSPSAAQSVAPTGAPSVSPLTIDSFDPALFLDGATITNPWFPLVPGTVYTSHGTKDGKAAVDVVTVTARTKVIAGVRTRVIDDRLTLGGVLEERTSDYYAQDRFGDVWYLGEDTAELDASGKVVSREGTWQAGVDGAKPGIFMEAKPAVGDTFLQEYLKGHAEDHFEVLSLTASVTVPFGSFNGALETKEWTPLEPDVLDHKIYVSGIGEVLETAVKGPKEELRLVSVRAP